MERMAEVAEVRALISERGYDAYGDTRVYFTWPESSVYAGQIGSVKSTIQLDEYVAEGVETFRIVENAHVPIRRA